jgi:hypothetical protein
VFPRVRLAFASCAFVLIMTYVAWHDQQRARTIARPNPPPALELASGLQTFAAPESRAQSALGPLLATEPELAPGPQVVAAAGSHSVLDPRPWSPGPAVPELQPVQTEAETAAEAPSMPESQQAATAPAVGSSAMMRETVIATGSPEVTPIPLPRPRPRKPPAPGPRNASTPLKLN